MKRTELVVLFLILVIAGGFRLWDIKITPPGLYPDEAMNGNDALQAIDSGHYKIFYPENNGREGLFMNLEAISIQTFGNHPWSLRLVSAIVGIFTVLGVYLLTRRLFDNWEIAAIAALLMATGFWHVNFSRIGFRAIMGPLCTVWALYYLYKGLETTRIWPWLVAGFWLGIGFHTYIAFRVIPGVVAVVLVVWLWSTHRAFKHDKFAHARAQLIGSAALMVAVMVIILLPMAAYFYSNPQDFVGRTTQVSVFSAEHPAQQLLINGLRTMGMFVVRGDGNWRHNIADAPVLFWPVAVFFAVGFARSIWKVGRSLRTHGHPSVVQAMLLGWFFIGLAPAVLSNEGIPHALRALIVSPAVYIIAAEGLWWLYQWLERWYSAHDSHQICLPRIMGLTHDGKRICMDKGVFVVSISLVALLFAIGVGDGKRYFVDWGQNPIVPAYFNQASVDLANRLNAMPPSTLKYVVVNHEDLLVNPPGYPDAKYAVPVSAQTVMYITDTWTPEKQKLHNVYYITPEQFAKRQYPRGAVVVQLDQ